MKKRHFPQVLGAAVAVLVTASVLNAQQPPSPGQGGGDGQRKMPTVEERLERMKKDLEITEDQAAKIKPILEDARKEMDSIREEAAGDRDAMREKMRASFDSIRAKIDEVLTPEQRAKAEEMRKNRRERAAAGGPGEGKPDKTE